MSGTVAGRLAGLYRSIPRIPGCVMDARHSDYALNRLRRKADGRNRLEVHTVYSLMRGSLPGISNYWTDEQLLAMLEAAGDVELIRLNGIPAYVLILQVAQAPDDDAPWLGMTIC